MAGRYHCLTPITTPSVRLLEGDVGVTPDGGLAQKPSQGHEKVRQKLVLVMIGIPIDPVVPALVIRQKQEFRRGSQKPSNDLGGIFNASDQVRSLAGG